MVLVSGVNYKWEGKVHRVRIQPGGDGKDFVTTVDGGDYVMITVRHPYGSDSAELYLLATGFRGAN